MEQIRYFQKAKLSMTWPVDIRHRDSEVQRTANGERLCHRDHRERQRQTAGKMFTATAKATDYGEITEDGNCNCNGNGNGFFLTTENTEDTEINDNGSSE
jgi:hypothetical protein